MKAQMRHNIHKAVRPMTADELMFFSGREGALALYAALREGIMLRWPETEIRVARTQITFRERYGYAFVSTRSMLRGWPEVFIVLSFGLGRELRSERIFAAVEPYPGRWTHHMCVTDTAELDDELFGFLAEAHDFALFKPGHSPWR